MSDERGGALAIHEDRREVGLPMEQRMMLLREALTNPEVDPAKASAMADLMFRMEDRDRETSFIAAKAAAIASMPRVGKDGQNTHTKSRYAKWETMQPLVTRHLNQYGLSLSFDMGGDGGKITVRPILQGHGWVERGDALVVPADASGQGTGRNQLQAIGSAISYAKRYAAMGMLNILTAGIVEDDDGHTGGGGDPRDLMTQAQRDLIDNGMAAAARGLESYETWFRSLPAAERGWLAFGGHHDELKEAASK